MFPRLSRWKGDGKPLGTKLSNREEDWTELSLQLFQSSLEHFSEFIQFMSLFTHHLQS